MNMRSRILGEAEKIVNGHREDDYGSPENSFVDACGYMACAAEIMLREEE